MRRGVPHACGRRAQAATACMQTTAAWESVVIHTVAAHTHTHTHTRTWWSVLAHQLYQHVSETRESHRFNTARAKPAPRTGSCDFKQGSTDLKPGYIHTLTLIHTINPHYIDGQRRFIQIRQLYLSYRLEAYTGHTHTHAHTCANPYYTSMVNEST